MSWSRKNIRKINNRQTVCIVCNTFI